MLLTLLEILIFMLLAAVLGVALGWILRGAMSNEQTEITELRSKLRECKKAQRDQAEGNGSAASGSNDKGKGSAAKAAAASTAASATASAASAKASAPAPKPAAAPKATSKASSSAAAKKAAKDEEKAAAQAAARAQVSKLVERVGSDGTVDDLKQIYGIGPKFETMLNEMGISSYKQITQFTSDDINTVADAIGAFKDRVVRDDWVSGAKDAYKAKYG